MSALGTLMMMAAVLGGDPQPLPKFWPYLAEARWDKERIFMWFLFYREDIVHEYHVDYMLLSDLD